MKLSLRAKLAVSHMLPILLLMPILSLYLLYSLEGFLTHSLTRQLTFQAQLVREQIEQFPETVESQPATQRFLAEIARQSDARVVVLSRDGTILASTRDEDADRIGTRFVDRSVQRALQGEQGEGVGPGFVGEVAYVVFPIQHDGATTGVLRLSYEIDDLRLQLNQLRWLIVVGVLLTAILGLGLGLGLATTITRPLRQLSESTHNIAAGNYAARVTLRSQDEVGRLAHDFNQMVARLEEAEQTRERQLAAIVHELARPLAGMQAAVETLRDGADADREARDALLAGVQEQVSRLDRMIGTLQSQHQRALRPMQLTRSRVSLERVIRSTAVNFEPIAAQCGVMLSLDIPNDLPGIHADEDRLIQVLTNLLDNAFKFTLRGGKITVQARMDNDAALVTVADTGVGIAPEELPHVFQQFYSGELRPLEKRGMGLGLTICREIVTAHGGQIWAESEPGQGARFTFSLPVG